MAHKASHEDLVANKIDLAFRDNCSQLLIELNKCRQANFYLPWRCHHERHAYEMCQYDEYLKRLKNPADASPKHH